MLFRVCVAIADDVARETVSRGLTASDVHVHQVDCRGLTLNSLGRQDCDLFLVNLRLLDHPVEDAVRLLKNLPDSPAVVLIAERDEPERRAEYLGMGCDAVLNAGLSSSGMIRALRALIDTRMGLREELVQTHDFSTGPRLSDFVSHSEAMRAFMRTVRKVCRGDTSLLITGETGVGKERLARAIHEDSPRRDGPFIPINCAAISGNLLESELFGHERGAFTGATRTRRGAFELGHKGTVFLDEVGDMPLNLQVKLLRVLQEREFIRLGGETTICIDVRIMAATNLDLRRAVEAGEFRKDLYYRLGVINLRIPPLRDRREDVDVLATSYLRHLQAKIRTSASDISLEVLAAMRAYDWPGNVRELINVIERAMLLCEDEIIRLRDLPEELARTGVDDDTALKSPHAAAVLDRDDDDSPWRRVRQRHVDKLEKAYLRSLLERNRGRIDVTANQAGMDTRSVYQKMRKHGLRKEEFKSER